MLERMPDLRSDAKIVDIDSLVPQDHLLRKVDKAVDFSHIYDMVEHLYCEDSGRPAADPIVLVKMVLIQHLFGIPSMRHTVAAHPFLAITSDIHPTFSSYFYTL